MVPPAPDPDDAHLDHDWLKHVDVALRLRRTGLVMQFSSVHDAAAGPLIAHIDAGPPGPLQVLTEAGALGQAPEGATVVLLNAGEWPDWLNQFRSVVNQQRLLLLLWLTDEDQMILKRRAPDFYDWISLRVTIPPCAPGYVLDELAATARDGGVLALHNAPSPPPGWTPVHLSAGYAALRTALSEGDVWLSGVTAADECITALIAHAEAHAKGHRGGALALVNPGAVHESTTVLDARPVPWIEATERLRARGVVDPGVAAARADLDPRKILDTVPSPATLIQNPEWDTLLSLVRAGVGPEALGLAARLELVGVVAVWRGEGVGQPFAPPSVVSAAPSTPTLARSVSTRTMVAVARTWLSAQAEAPVFAEALRALDNALSSAHYADDARLTALGPLVLRLRQLDDSSRAAEAMAELLIVAGAWLPEDDVPQAEATRRLRDLHTEGVIPTPLWAWALLRRVERLLLAPQVEGSEPEMEAHLAELATLDLDVHLGAARQLSLGHLRHQQGRLKEALDEGIAVVQLLSELGEPTTPAWALVAELRVVSGELDEALRIYREELLPVIERHGDLRSKAITLCRIADILLSRGQLVEAQNILRNEALPIFEQIGDVREKAVTMGKIADVLEVSGQLDEALRIRRDEQLPVFERIGDVQQRAVTLSKIADVFQTRGEFDEALRIRQVDALPIFERLGDVRSKAITISNIADIFQARGQLDEVLRIRREEELPVHERFGDVRERAVTMGKIAIVLQARGQLDEALRICQEEVLPVFERLGDLRSKAITLSNIADILQAGGQLEEAIRIHREGVLPVFEQLGDMRSKAITMNKIADALQARGQLDEALKLRRDDVLPLQERLGDIRDMAVTMSRIADALHARGQLDEALKIRQDEVLPIYERLGDTRAKAATMNKIAELLEARGQLDEAQKILRDEVLPVFERLHTQPDLLVSQAHLATNLLLRHKPKLRAEARALLTTALESAKGLNLPAEAEHIRSIFRRYNLSVPA